MAARALTRLRAFSEMQMYWCSVLSASLGIRAGRAGSNVVTGQGAYPAERRERDKVSRGGFEFGKRRTETQSLIVFPGVCRRLLVPKTDRSRSARMGVRKEASALPLRPWTKL